MSVEEKAGRVNTWLPEFASGGELMKTAGPEGMRHAGEDRGTYYDTPMLKRPLWRWEIALYFLLEGISAGAFLLATMADLFARGKYKEMIGAARYLSFVTLLPCPPLLIADLGRPERFHHMLRIWKPYSPMNTGAWALSGYSLPVGLLAVKQLTGDGPLSGINPLKKTSQLVPSRTLEALGLPFTLTMLCYPGVLLSTTSSPIWSRNRFLGALFACSSISSGAAALSLILSLRGKSDGKAVDRLESFETVATLCEAATLGAYIVSSRDAAEPLTGGRYAKHFWLGAVGAGLALPTLLKLATPKSPKPGRTSTIFKSALALAGALALKWAVVHAGRTSAETYFSDRSDGKSLQP
jgi:formate-dependent nitrite reductase membrane component NrfD